MKLAWATDPGLQREENEDAVLVERDHGGLDALIVVCDGMGGHAAGHLASSVASETFMRAIREDGKRGPEPERLRAASVEANTAVHEASKQNSAWAGMGSTLTVVGILGDQLAIVNVGDSPAYLFRNGDWTLISQDHSWPAEQARLGLITQDQAKDHPMKHRLTRAIGVWDHIASYTHRIQLRTGDTVVICSDGVETAGVEVEEMWALLQGADLGPGIQRVIDRCKELGAPDNVTVAVASFDGVEPVTERTAVLKALTPADLKKKTG